MYLQSKRIGSPGDPQRSETSHCRDTGRLSTQSLTPTWCATNDYHLSAKKAVTLTDSRPTIPAQSYTQTLRISNRLGARVEASVRPGAAERYTVTPERVVLKAGETAEVKVTLKVLRFGASKKAQERGQRDFFHIKVSPPSGHARKGHGPLVLDKLAPSKLKQLPSMATLRLE